MTKELRNLQFAELDILKKIIEICDAHNLTYYAVGGTLIGASRHQGFIPWDDDIDIALPRPDYDCFLRIARNELTEPYQLRTIDGCRNEIAYYYAKVENNSILLQFTARKNKNQVPVWVDVFPLDGAPNDTKTARKWLSTGYRLNKLLGLSQYSYKAAEDLRRKPFNRIFLLLKIEKLISTKRVWRALNSVATKYPYDKSTKVCNFCGRYGEKEITYKSILGKGCHLPFETIEINCPENYDAYLRNIYGDYMTLPPESERTTHDVKVIYTKLLTGDVRESV